MPKRGASGEELYRFNPRPRYAADFLPDPRLLKFEDEPPGYIHAVGGDLTKCYVKVVVSKTVDVWVEDPSGPVCRPVVHTLYVWKRV